MPSTILSKMPNISTLQYRVSPQAGQFLHLAKLSDKNYEIGRKIGEKNLAEMRRVCKNWNNWYDNHLKLSTIGTFGISAISRMTPVCDSAPKVLFVLVQLVVLEWIEQLWSMFGSWIII